MALDLYLQKDASIPKSLKNNFLSFEDDEGYLGFLYPFFEVIANKTGQLIKTDDAFFQGADLNLFYEMIEQARRALTSKPDVWDEHTGTVFYKGVRKKTEKIYSTVQKSELEDILSKLERAVSEAKNKNIGIFFFGD